MEALAQSSSSKRCPPSFALRQAGRLPRVRKTLPRPYRTPSQDALWPGISSRGTGGPLLVPGDRAHFLSPWEPASAQRWPVQPSPSSRSCTTGGGGANGNSGITLLHLPKHLFYLQQPIKHHGLRGQVKVSCVCLTHPSAQI